MARIGEWLEERTSLSAVGRAVFRRNVPLGVGVLYTLGFAAAFVFALQIATGIVLALYYAPTPDHAHASVAYVTNEVAFGRIVRGLHHWGSSAMVVLVVAHLIVVFALAAYKRPREVTWLLGVALLVLTLAFGFTGYLLPWDEKAYWATSVGTNMLGTVPFAGEFLLRVARGGVELGASTLTRFYALHVLVLPAVTAVLIALHVALVIRHGVSVPPSLWHAEWQSAPPLPPPSSRERQPAEAARYAAFKQAGRPFWPDVIAEDLGIATMVFLVLLGLTVSVGVPLEAPADPTNTSYIPRPEWYFLGLFQLLRYFPGHLEWVGVVLLPLLGMLALVLLPFVDRGPERRLVRRPVAGAVALALAVSTGYLTAAAVLTTPPTSAEERGVRLNVVQVLGRAQYRQYCASCHGAAGEGSPLGPGLVETAQRGDVNFIHSYIEDPQRLARGAVMPGFGGQLGHQQVEEITQYVLTFAAEVR
jgi:ubiquinol-cytochrome c reductase cytochrome b subunit